MNLTARAVSSPLLKFARVACVTLVAGVVASQLIRTTIGTGNRAPSITRVSAASSDAQTDSSNQKNVFDQSLEQCSTRPLTGYYRDGYCKTDASDHGVHTVCASVTDDFLQFSRQRGNDLITPHGTSFPGLRAGDRWCLCAARWDEAQQANKAPNVVLAATHKNTLRTVPLQTLQEFALDSNSADDL